MPGDILAHISFFGGRYKCCKPLNTMTPRQITPQLFNFLTNKEGNRTILTSIIHWWFIGDYFTHYFFHDFALTQYHRSQSLLLVLLVIAHYILILLVILIHHDGKRGSKLGGALFCLLQFPWNYNADRGVLQCNPNGQIATFWHV